MGRFADLAGGTIPAERLASAEAPVAAHLRDEDTALEAPPELAELLRRVGFFYEPIEVWLFGSRARGDARPNSDWDLLVVVDDSVSDAALDPDVAWRLQRGCGVHADIVAYRESEFAAEARVRSTLAHEVAHHGGRRLRAPAI